MFWSMFWRITLYGVLFGAGSVYAGFGIVNPMICVNFALPATRKLADRGWFNNARVVRKKYRLSILIWAVINLVVFVIFFAFVPLRNMIAFYAGVVLSGLVGLTKSGANGTNIEEYFASCAPYLVSVDKESLEAMVCILRGK